MELLHHRQEDGDDHEDSRDALKHDVLHRQAVRTVLLEPSDGLTDRPTYPMWLYRIDGVCSVLGIATIRAGIAGEPARRGAQFAERRA